MLTIISGLSNASARQPTPAELEAIRKETKIVFQNFLQLWQEERYFELYEYGKIHSKNQLTNFLNGQKLQLKIMSQKWKKELVKIVSFMRVLLVSG